MEEDDIQEMGRIASDLSNRVSDELTKTFESIAKIAMQAAARSSDPKIAMIEKVRRAHSDLTLIVDEAMRGMNKATEWAIGQAIFEGAKSQHEE